MVSPLPLVSPAPTLVPVLPRLTDDERRLPAMSAEADGFPDGWTVRRVPRASGEGRADNVFYSPDLELRFSSRPAAERYVKCLERAGGCEASAAELYKKEETARRKSPARKTDSKSGGCGNSSSRNSSSRKWTCRACPNVAMSSCIAGDLGLCKECGPKCTMEGCTNAEFRSGLCRRHHGVQRGIETGEEGAEGTPAGTNGDSAGRGSGPRERHCNVQEGSGRGDEGDEVVLVRRENDDSSTYSDITSQTRAAILPGAIKEQVRALLPRRGGGIKGMKAGKIAKRVKGFLGACRGASVDEVLKSNFPGEIEAELKRGKFRYFLRSAEPRVLNGRRVSAREQQEHPVDTVAGGKAGIGGDSNPNANPTTAPGGRPGSRDPSPASFSAGGGGAAVKADPDADGVPSKNSKFSPGGRAGEDASGGNGDDGKSFSPPSGSGGNGDGGEADKTAFPILLHEIVTDPATDDCVHWLPCGTHFIISDKRVFARDLLPRFYGQAKFTSFLRRLKRLSFTRVPSGPYMGAYYNANFRRDEPELAVRVRCDHPSSIAGHAMHLNRARMEALSAAASVGMGGMNPMAAMMAAAVGGAGGGGGFGGIPTGKVGGNRKSQDGETRVEEEIETIRLSPVQAKQTKFPLGCEVLYGHERGNGSSTAVVKFGAILSVRISLKGDFRYEVGPKASQDCEGGDTDKVMMREHFLAYAPMTPVYLRSASGPGEKREGTVLLASRTGSSPSEMYQYAVLTSRDDGERIMEYDVAPGRLSFRADAIRGEAASDEWVIGGGHAKEVDLVSEAPRVKIEAESSSDDDVSASEECEASSAERSPNLGHVRKALGKYAEAEAVDSEAGHKSDDESCLANTRNSREAALKKKKRSKKKKHKKRKEKKRSKDQNADAKQAEPTAKRARLSSDGQQDTNGSRMDGNQQSEEHTKTGTPEMEQKSTQKGLEKELNAETKAKDAQAADKGDALSEEGATGARWWVGRWGDAEGG